MSEQVPQQAAPKKRAWVRHVVDYLGLAAFLAVLVVTRSLETATWGLVVGAAGAIAMGLIFEKRLAPLPLVTGLLALFFGGLTLIFHDTRFIKMKPTVVYLGFAGFLLLGMLRGRNPLRALMGDVIHLPDEAMRILTRRYALFFLALAGANEFVWRTQTDQAWGWFKASIVVIILVFAVAQTPLMMKYGKEPEVEPPPVD
jgi:intracellular septation protein